MVGGKILVIDDDPLNRKLLRALLTLGKYEVVEFPDAESGIRHARESFPDCILLDLKLPGMDGLAAVRLIKADPVLKAVPVVAVTSLAMKGDERRALDAGCDGYITKPIDTRTFLDNIRHFLQKKRQAIQVEDALQLGGPPSVLVVDDDESILKVFRGMLLRGGYQVLTAASGEEALARALSDNPDLILLDVKMPDLNGYEVTRRLKANLATLAIPVIMITGYADREHRVAGLEAGADEFLAKPVDSVELLVRMKSMINLKRSQDRLARSIPDSENSAASAPGAATAGPSRVLLVARENDAAAESIFAVLREQGSIIVRAGTSEEALSIVSQGGVDVMFISSLAASEETLQLSRFLKDEEGTRNLQIIAMVPPDEPAKRLAAFESGADDCMAWPLDLRELSARLKLHSRRKARMDELQARYRAAADAAASDGLTGLVHNTGFKKLLDLELKRARRHSHSCVLLIADIDDFKRRNDTLGHLAGDLLLTEVAQVLKAGIREIDVAARYGGEEFAVLLPDTDEPGARIVGERLRAAVASRVFLQGSSTSGESLTVSIGMARFPADADTPDDLIRKADARLYLAKRKGKNRLCSSDDGEGRTPAE